MKSIKIAATLVLSIIAAAYAGITPAGRSGGTFLKISPSPLASGMGEAYAASARGPEGLWYNPAGCVQDSGWRISAAYNYHLAAAQNNYLAVIRGSGNWAFGAAFQILSVDGYEFRTDVPTAEPLGTFSSQDMALGITGAYSILQNLTFGVTAKTFYEKLSQEDAGGWAWDFGVRWRPVDKVVAGLAVLNLSSNPKYGIDPYPLPMTYRGGLAWTPGTLWGADWLLEGDIVKPDWESPKGNFGLAAAFSERITLRLGYMLGYSTRSVTGGVGIHFSRWDFDYAVVPYTGGFGWSHRLGLSFAIP